MTTVSLAAIADALREYEANANRWPNDLLMRQWALRDLVAEITPDALAALVAIAVAAKSIVPQDPTHVITTLEETQKARDAWIAFIQALKAVE